MEEQGRRVSDHNKELMQRFYDEVVNAGNIDLIDELLADDFVEHEELPGLAPGREGVKQFLGMFKAAFPDSAFTVGNMIAEGDFVAARVTIRGTHEGEFMGIPATSRSVEFEAIDLLQFADGTATAHWGVSDLMTMMQQLGAMPEPG